jgi:hypothetical protein
MSTKPIPENAAFAIGQMRKYAKLSHDAQMAATERRKDHQTKVELQVYSGYRTALSGAVDTVADALVSSDPQYRLHVGNNQFYRDLTNMWASVAMVELKLMELDVQTPDSIRQAGAPRAE